MKIFISTNHQTSSSARLLAGGALSLGIVTFALSIFIEQPELAIYIATLPAVLIGIVIGSLRAIPPIKIWVSLGVLTLFALASLVTVKTKNHFIQEKREMIAAALLPQYPQAKRLSEQYSPGDNTKNEPSVKRNYTSKDTFEAILHYYHQELTKDNWSSKSTGNSSKVLWKKDRFWIELSFDGINENGETKYSHVMKFWGDWLDDLSYQRDSSNPE